MWRAGLLSLSLDGVLAVPSASCPDVQQGTFQACERCINDDLCQTDSRLNIKYVCDHFTKKCVNPAWNVTEILQNCPEDPADPSTWGAQCKLSCPDQQVPYACAAQRCVNEDFPCNWARGCGIPFGMHRTSLACLRSCSDHNDMLSMVGFEQTCKEIIGRFGCQGSTLALNIPEFCPVSCKSPECEYRCNRVWQEGGEVPNVQQQRCWTQIDGGLGCLDAIKLGQDCHCKCASYYVRMSSIRGRKPGALSISDTLDGQVLSLNLEATVATTFSLDFTGERMRSEDPAALAGPRLKIIPDNEICSTSALAWNITGLSCTQPPGTTGGYVCDTPPSLASPFLHRWAGIQMNACGRFLLCHCNENCDIKSQWVRAGYLEVKPRVTFGSMSAPLPGCDAYLPTLPPQQADPGTGETLQKTLVTSYLSIDGDMDRRPLPNVLDAIRKAIARYTSVRSELLDAVVPSEEDIEVQDYHRPDLGDRRLQSCEDDDAAFQVEAAKASLPGVTSCAEEVALLGKDLICQDQTLADAVLVGCRASCGLCVPGSETTSSAAGESTQSTSSSTTTEAAIVWPGAADAAHLVVVITARTDLVRDNVANQMEYIKTDPQPLLLDIYDELEAIGMFVGQMWAYVALGPIMEEAPPDTTTTPPPPTWTASSMIMVILIVSFGVGGLISCVCVGMYMYVQSQKNAEGTEDQEVVERSEGGYRTKRKVIPGTPGEPPKESKPGCLSRCLSRCYRKLCPKKQIRRVAPVMEESAGLLVVGAHVRLMGLSQAHFNGLEGYVTGGPNDKGRYTVDIIMNDDEMTREMQTLSFKADNLLVLPPEHANSQAANLPGRGPSSYRGGA